MSRCERIPAALILRDIASGSPLPWSMEHLCEHPGLTMEMVAENPSLNWHESLLFHPGFTVDFLLSSDLSRNDHLWVYLSRNPNLTMEYLLSHPEIPRTPYLYRNPNLARPGAGTQCPGFRPGSPGLVEIRSRKTDRLGALRMAGLDGESAKMEARHADPALVAAQIKKIDTSPSFPVYMYFIDVSDDLFFVPRGTK